MNIGWILRRTWLIDLCVIALLLALFSALYLPQMSWGSWGDDSPGYIYTAGQLYRGERLVIQDPLVERGLAYFGNEKYARFLAPTHHEIIAPSGWIASRYPTGLSLMMAGLGRVGDFFGIPNGYAMYVIAPMMAILVVVLVYAIAVLWLPYGRFTNRGIGILAAITTGLTPLFSDYAVSQPMRDIPALAMLLLALACIGVIKYRARRSITITGLSWGWLVVAAAAFAQAINIRETSIIVFPVFLLALHLSLPNMKISLANWRALTKVLLVASIAFIAVLGIMITNSVEISLHKEKFRSKDISGIAITSNFDHIQSLSPANLFNNQGKFRPGVGGVYEYWSVLQKFSVWEFFLPMSLVGLVALWFRNRKLTIMIAYWIASIYILFGMWINPYARYVLPVLPMLAIFSAIGSAEIIPWLQRTLRLSRFTTVVLAMIWALSIFVSWQPAVQAETADIASGHLTNKSIHYADLLGLDVLVKQIEQQAGTDASKPPLLVMLGQWKPGISEMLMAHNTVRVIRYPTKPAERASEEQVNTFISSLADQYQLYIWYDSTANAAEQRYFSTLPLTELGRFDFSFQSAVALYSYKKL